MEYWVVFVTDDKEFALEIKKECEDKTGLEFHLLEIGQVK